MAFIGRSGLSAARGRLPTPGRPVHEHGGAAAVAGPGILKSAERIPWMFAEDVTLTARPRTRSVYAGDACFLDGRSSHRRRIAAPVPTS